MRGFSGETIAKIVTRAGQSTTAGSFLGAPWLALGNVTHNQSLYYFGAGLALAGVICAALPKIITAWSEGVVARTEARSEAEALRGRRETRSALVLLGTDADKIAQVAKLLRYELLNPDLPGGRRPSDKALVDLAKEEIRAEAVIPPGPPRSSKSSRPPAASPNGGIPTQSRDAGTTAYKDSTGDVNGDVNGVVIQMHAEDQPS
jgi:hypothetical protein